MPDGLIRMRTRLRPATFGAAPSGERLQRIHRSPQFVDGALQNPLSTAVIQSGSSARALRAQLTGWRQRKPGFEIPVHRLTSDDLSSPPVSGLRVTWLGHATVLAELGAQRVLFDPVWSARCSPFSFAGPGRCHPDPIALTELPEIDVVAISHDHYDHLDKATVSALADGTSAVFAVPLGIGAHLEHWGVPPARIVELDWHETATVGELLLTATPARHYCSRGLRRSPTTLWSSWVVVNERHRVFHCGDSGYFPQLADIGAEYGPFDTTMIPIGAYHDLWPDVHMTPEEAMTAHHDLDGAAMLPIHWGTYTLAPHPWAEPIERAVSAARSMDAALLAPRPGQPVEPTRQHSADLATPWWQPGHAESSSRKPTFSPT